METILNACWLRTGRRALGSLATVALLSFLPAPTRAADDTVLRASVAAESDQALQTLLASEHVRRDTATEQVLAQVAQTLAAGGAADPARLRFVVIDEPQAYALSLANGGIVVSTGLLGHLENEAQLAALLAHELVHVRDSHSLEAVKEQARREGGRGGGISGLLGKVTGPAGVAGSLPGVPDVPLTGIDEASSAISALEGLAGQLGSASAAGYGERFERQADEGGMALVARAGYASAEAARAWEVLARYGSASANLLHSNPESLTQRYEAAARAARSNPGGARGTNAVEYCGRLSAAKRWVAEQELAAKRFTAAELVVDCLVRAQPEEPRMQYLRGRVLAGKGQSVAAVEVFRAVLAKKPDQPDTIRELGLAYRDLGDSQKALEQLRRYLELRPNSPEIEAIVAELSAANSDAW